MNNWFQSNNHQLPLEIAKFKMIGNKRCDGYLHEELGILFHNFISVVVNLEFIMVKIHLNATVVITP